jgi:hypothetical protein
VIAINETLVMFLLYLKHYYWFTATFKQQHDTFPYLVPNEELQVICDISRNNPKKDEE